MCMGGGGGAEREWIHNSHQSEILVSQDYLITMGIRY